MEENSSYQLIEINIANFDLLNQIRHWGNLKIASHHESIWVKGFTKEQLEDNALLSIPYTKSYICIDNNLYLKNHIILERKIPNLLWSPIELAIPVDLPKGNFNFFGLKYHYAPKLIPTKNEAIASILIVDISSVDKYIHNAPNFRLARLEWIALPSNRAMIKGLPMLPIQGEAYWQLDNFILPVGFTLEFSFLKNEIAKKIDNTDLHYIWWATEYEYVLIEKSSFTILSISSWALTTQFS